VKIKILLITALFIVLGFTVSDQTGIVFNNVKIADAGRVEFLTYYPSPFGIYDRLRLHPRAALSEGAPDEPCQIGTMYVNRDNNYGFFMCQNLDGTAGDDEDGEWDLVSPWRQRSDSDGDNPVVYLEDTTFNANVAIGTSTPVPWSSGYSSLQLGNYTGLANFQTGYTVLGNNYHAEVANGGHKHINNGLASYYRQYGGTHDFVVTNVNPGADGTMVRNRAMFINSNGNVGIGTTDPQATLDIEGSTRLGGNMVTDGGSCSAATGYTRLGNMCISSTGTGILVVDNTSTSSVPVQTVSLSGLLSGTQAKAVSLRVNCFVQTPGGGAYNAINSLYIGSPGAVGGGPSGATHVCAAILWGEDNGKNQDFAGPYIIRLGANYTFDYITNVYSSPSGARVQIYLDGYYE